MSGKPLVSIVVPMYNEEDIFDALEKRLLSFFDSMNETCDFEVIMVNDGSRDKTWELVSGLTRRDSRFTGIKLSRNFGHQFAITAGHHFATGDAVVDMDADLQDPPEFIAEMIKAWQDGHEVVLCKRKSREGESFFKLVTAKLFYKLIGWVAHIELHPEVGDFRLISKRVNNEFVKMTEVSRYVRGMVSWMGYSTIVLEYDRHEREAGETKYPFIKMFNFAVNGLVSMSSRPLKMAYVMAGIGAAPFLLYLFYTYFKATFLGGVLVPGWTSMILSTIIFGTMILFMLGIIGEYIARIYDEIKPRPLFFVDTVAKKDGDFKPGEDG